MDGSAVEKDGKLHFHGTVKSEDEKNQIWNALKAVPDYQREVMADIKVVPQAAAAAGAGAGGGAQATGARRRAGPTPSRPATRSAVSPSSISATPAKTPRFSRPTATC